MIYYDAYQEGHYGAAITRDFKTFKDATKGVSFPEGHKHGTVLQISRKHLEHLLNAGSKP